MARICYYTNESFAERIGGGRVLYRIAKVTEDEPGYHIEFKDEDLGHAQAWVQRTNADMGLSADDVSAIVISSMAAGRVADQ
jgi:hypothetical protein